MEYLQRENEFLKQRIEFLEKVIGIHIETNYKLFEQIEAMENKEVVTYFSPFTGLPVMVETKTNKYMVDVRKVIEVED